MNVWIINHYATLPSDSGGFIRHFALARELVGGGHNVTIIASSFTHFSHKDTKLAPDEELKVELVEGVRFVWLRTPWYSGNSVQRVLNMLAFSRGIGTRAIRNLEPDPAVILCSSPHLFAAAAAAKLARSKRIPFVLEIRDFWPDSLVDIGGIPRWHPFILWLSRLEKRVYKAAQRIITLLPLASDYLMGFGVPEANIEWIPNGIDFDMAPPPQRREEGSGRFVVMYAGAHGLANGLDTVLDAAKVIREERWGEKVDFHLVGDGPEKARLAKRASEEGITNVVFRDPVSKRGIYEVLLEADAFIMILKSASVFRWGLSPNKLWDYFAAARPVIFSVSSSHNPVESAGAGLSVEPDNPVKMAEAVGKLLRLPAEERQRMGLSGRAYVEKNHDFKVLAKRLGNLLAGLVGAAAV